MNDCIVCGIGISALNVLCDSCVVEAESARKEVIKHLHNSVEDGYGAGTTTINTALTPFSAYTLAPSAQIVSAPQIKRTKVKKPVTNEPLATLIQEHPYKIYQIKRRVSSKDFLTWLNEVKDVNFGITMGKETIRFKTPRDVSNFMLGFNVCADMLDGMF